jgi:hypothetical protein
MTMFEQCAVRFSEAARMAALLELFVRHLADCTPQLRPVAMAHNLVTTEDAILAHFAPVLLPGESNAIRAARGIRNKLLHCEFWTALARIEGTGRVPHRPPVTMVNLATGVVLDAVDVGETEPRIYGWVALGAAKGGFFEHADEAFSEALRAVKRLFGEAVQ